MAEIKFYQDAAKQNQIYPEINPDGIYPGVTVGLADNLTSSDGLTDVDTWQYRTTGGELDISDGYAEIKKLIGTTISSTIEESLTYNLLASGVSAVTIDNSTFSSIVSQSGTYNFTYSPVISYNSPLVYSLNKVTFANHVEQQTGTYTFTREAQVAIHANQEVITSFSQSTFITKVNENPGSYLFEYDSENQTWSLYDTAVTLSEYGIVVNGTETEGCEIEVLYSSNAWYINHELVSLNAYGIITTGNESVGDTIVINYTDNVWMLNNSEVTLSNYGVTITTGNPIVGDIIQIIYVAEQIGVIQTSNPTGLFSIGMNQFNKNGNKILSGYTIDSTGAIVAATGSYIIYFKVVGGETYTIYNSNINSITRAGYSASVPNISSTVTILNTVSSSEWCDTLINDNYKKHYAPANEGYLCVAVTNIEDLCCHLTWEGYNDEVFESYYDYTLSIPYIDKNGTTITNYGLVNLDDTEEYYDEIDFVENKFYKRTTRIAYSAANLEQVQAMGVPYLYDNNYIYYGIETISYDLPEISNAYQMSNFGTEEFIGSTTDLIATVFYQDNLKDKLRFSAEVIDNKTTDILNNANNTYYPTSQAVLDLENMIWRMLGLQTTTFSTTSTYAVGDYVIYNHLLYKCTTAVTSAGAWTGSTNWTETPLFIA